MRKILLDMGRYLDEDNLYEDEIEELLEEMSPEEAAFSRGYNESR